MAKCISRVAKNKSMPFIVEWVMKQSGSGYLFNVNRYTDEPAGKISLVDGSIKVNGTLLQPVQAYTNGMIVSTNIEQCRPIRVVGAG